MTTTSVNPTPAGSAHPLLLERDRLTMLTPIADVA